MSVRKLSTLLLVSFLLVSPLLADGRAEANAEAGAAGEAASPDLSGEWRLFLPKGFERKVTLEPAPDGHYFLSPYTLHGTYERRGNRLVWISSERLTLGTEVERFRSYEWEIRSPYLLTLVSQPKNPPADYLGAVLFRANSEQERTSEKLRDDVREDREEKGPSAEPAFRPIR